MSCFSNNIEKTHIFSNPFFTNFNAVLYGQPYFYPIFVACQDEIENKHFLMLKL